MAKKLLVLTALLLCIGTMSLSAIGIGIQGGGGYGGYGRAGGALGGAAITFKLDDIPWVFAVDATIRGSGFGIGLTADMWVINQPVVGPLNFFAGWGLFGSVFISNSPSFAVGARLVAGLNMFLLDGFLEPYIQVAPGIGLHISPIGLYWNIPANIGIRFWF
ncbi:MAG: hypothetical protein LBU99_00475 [Spirochaetaceae bacterium]|jgi:hypothetical protein|nr:hypothetical protein [Spirochaetaceae bacterium]